MQNAAIIGNLVADGETKKKKDGSEYIAFRVAVNENRGEEKKTQYFDVFCPVSGVIKHLKKGQKVYTYGHLTLSSSSRDGKTYVNASISAKDIEIMFTQQD